VEWQFRSNHPVSNDFFCDAEFVVSYQDINDKTFMYGDRALPGGEGTMSVPLEIEEFHTYRFESLNGQHYWISVDGLVFVEVCVNSGPLVFHLIQFASHGGCLLDWIPNKKDEWDMIRYGTISYGERVIGAEPPMGYVHPAWQPGFDRFTVVYDAPNYAYLDDIVIEVTGGDTPVVIATKRLDNGPPEVLEIRLDRPIPPGERTTFTFHDGAVVNRVVYSFQSDGDVNGDGRVDLRDLGVLQNCYASPVTVFDQCGAFDFAPDEMINAEDFDDFLWIMLTSGP
jgi:hypothetical protein